jgi:hypothetical protein
MSKHKRTQIELNPTIAEILASPPGRPRASNNTNNNRHKATYDLQPETIQAVRDLAEKLGVPVYAVAQKLLDHALSNYEAGQLKLKRQAVVTTWSLE